LDVLLQVYDLPQGSLKIPCKLLFRGDRILVDKLKQLLHKVFCLSPVSFWQVPIRNCGETPRPSIVNATVESVVVIVVAAAHDADSKDV